MFFALVTSIATHSVLNTCHGGLKSVLYLNIERVKNKHQIPFVKKKCYKILIDNWVFYENQKKNHHVCCYCM